MKLFMCLMALLSVAFAEEAPFKKLVEKSGPLKLESKKIDKDGVVLQVTPLLAEKPYLSDSFSIGPRSIGVENGKLHVLIGDKHHVWNLPKKDGEKLKYDASHGDQGIAPYSKENKGWQPKEQWDHWGKKLLSRKVGEYIGHPSSEGNDHLLLLKDADGKELRKLGFIEGRTSICWLQNFCEWKQLVFLVDSNCRKIVIWNLDGDFLLEVSCDELGLDYPWPLSIDITDEGVMYIGFTQERPLLGTDVRDSDVSETAFLKVTGLQSILDRGVPEGANKTGMELLEEKAAKISRPLEFDEHIIKKKGAILQVTPLLMERPFLTERSDMGVQSIDVEGARLHALFDNGDLVRHYLLNIPAKKGKLVADPEFGDQGVKLFNEHKDKWKTGEKFGWMNLVISRPLGKLMGHSDPENGKLTLKDKEGKELAVLGVLNGESDISLLQNFCGWKELVFLVDGRSDKIGVWTIKGEKLFDVASEELGLDDPRLGSIDVSQDGVLYLGFTHEREALEGSAKSGVTESAFLKITGLDTIKAK